VDVIDTVKNQKVSTIKVGRPEVPGIVSPKPDPHGIVIAK
jgi:hypothetical protein